MLKRTTCWQQGLPLVSQGDSRVGPSQGDSRVGWRCPRQCQRFGSGAAQGSCPAAGVWRCSMQLPDPADPQPAKSTQPSQKPRFTLLRMLDRYRRTCSRVRACVESRVCAVGHLMKLRPYSAIRDCRARKDLPRILMQILMQIQTWCASTLMTERMHTSSTDIGRCSDLVGLPAMTRHLGEAWRLLGRSMATTFRRFDRCVRGDPHGYA